MSSNWLDLSGSANNFRRSYVHGFLDISGGPVNIRNSDKVHFYDGLDNKKFSIKHDEFSVTDSNLQGHIVKTEKLAHIKNLTSDVNSDINTLQDKTQNLTSTATDSTFNSTVKLTGTDSYFLGDVSGNANTASKLKDTVLIGGVSFDGSSSISLKGVNQQGNQNTTGSAATVSSAAQPNIQTLLNVTALGNANAILSVNAPTNLLSTTTAKEMFTAEKGVTISGAGTIDNTAIGETTPSTGKFSSLTLNSALSVSDGGTGSNTASVAASNLGLGTEDSPTFTNITSSSAPTNDQHAATKKYVDDIKQDLEDNTDPTKVVYMDGNQVIGGVKQFSQNVVVAVEPTQRTHLTNKGYVDDLVQGLDVKPSVLYATENNIDLSNCTQIVDSQSTHTLSIGDRILVKEQSDNKENGIYEYQGLGKLSRAVDFDETADIRGAFTFVEDGVFAGEGYIQNYQSAVMNATPITFGKFSHAGTINPGSGLKTVGTVFSINEVTNGGINFDSDLKAFVDLAHSDIGNFLPANKGGTNSTTYQQGDLLQGNSSNSLSKLNKGADNTVLSVNSSGELEYSKVIDGLIQTSTIANDKLVNDTITLTGANSAVALKLGETVNTDDVLDTVGVVRTIGDQEITGLKTFNNGVLLKGTSSNLTVNGDVHIDGKLVVEQDIEISTTLRTELEDPIIDIGKGNTGGVKDLGLILHRGTDLSNCFIGFDESEDKFKLGTVDLEGNNDTVGTVTTGILSAELDGNAATVTNGVYTVGDQSIGGIKTFSSKVNADISGNAATVTDGVTMSDEQTISGIKTFSSKIKGDLSGNADTVTNGVYNVGDQSIDGVKTFNETIQGSISGNAATVTNGLYTTSTLFITNDMIQDNTISLSGNKVTGTLPIASGGTNTTSLPMLSVITASDKAGARTALDLSTANDVQFNSVQVSGAPSSDNQVATKGYVDSVVEGLDVKDSVVAASLTNISLTGTLTNGLLDGVTIINNDRILIKDQTNAEENGIYAYNPNGAWLRTVDFDENSGDVKGAFTFVEGGTQAGNGYVCSNTGTVSFGSIPITFSQFSGAGQITAGAGLSKVGNEMKLTETEIKFSGLTLTLGSEHTRTQIATDLHIVDDDNDQTIGGVKTFSNKIKADISGNADTASAAESGSALETKISSLTADGSQYSGNAATVTNGIYTTSSATALSDISSVGSGSIITSTERSKLTTIDENADVTTFASVKTAGGVMTTEDQTISGTKTFSDSIVGDLSGNASSVTNGVYTTDTGTVTNAMLAGSIDLTSKVTGSLPVTSGGTGANTVSGARTNLSAAKSGDNTDITSLGALTSVDINGGTIDGVLIGESDRPTAKLDELDVSSNSVFKGAVAISDDTTSNAASTGALVVSGGVGIGGDLHVHNNAIITGNFTVNGTTTTINSTNSVVKDALIELSTNRTTEDDNDSGLIIKRHTNAKNAFIGFDEYDNKFKVGLTNASGTSSGPISLTDVGILKANIEGTLTGDVIGDSATASAAKSGSVLEAKISGLSADGSDLSGNAATATTALACSGNAASVTNGLYTTDDGTIVESNIQDDAIDLSGSKVSGVLPVSRGGTGATDIDSLRTNVGAAALGDNTDITSLGALTSIDINGGTIDGTTIATSNINMLGKTLDLSGGTLTLSNEQKLDIIQTTESNVDFGLYDVRASTFTADELTAGRVVFTGTDGLLSDSDKFLYDDVNHILNVKNGGKINTNDLEATGGSLAGVNVDVTNATLTTSATQNKAILEGITQDSTLNFNVTALGGKFNNLADSSNGTTRVVFADASGNLTETNQVKLTNDVLEVTSLKPDTLITSAAQNKSILESAESNIDFGSYNIRANTITADGLSAGTVVFTGTDGLLSSESTLSYTANTDTLNATNMVVNGNLTVSGTTTSVNSTNIDISENILGLSKGTTGTPIKDAGLLIERGDLSNCFIGFNENTNKFTVGFTEDDTNSTNVTLIDVGTLVANIEGQVSSIDNHDTDVLPEGANNLYYTNARVHDAISIVDASGGVGNLEYNSSNGELTYTGPSSSQVRSFFTEGTGIDITSGEISLDETANVEFNTVTAGFIGDVSGNATSVSNGVYTNTDQTITGIKTFTKEILGTVQFVTNGVYTTGNQTIAGVKQFSSTITGSISGNAATADAANTGSALESKISSLSANGSEYSGNAATVTNGLYTTGDQTIAGVKEFTSDISGNIATATLAAQVTNGVYTTDTKTVTAAMLAEDAVDLSGSHVITGVLQVANGGTGATDAGAAATALGLGTGDSPTFTNIISSSAPSSDNHVTTKSYVDGLVQGLDIKDSVVAATTANIDLSGALTIDSISVTAGDRVLVKEQTDASGNGIYLCVDGPWTRVTDMAAGDDAKGNFVFVEQGTINGNAGFVCTNDTNATVDTHDLTFTQFSGAGQVTTDTSLSKSGNQLSVAFGSNGAISNDSGLKVGVDDSTIEVHTDNKLRIKGTSIANSHIATDAAIADSKLATISTSDKVEGGAIKLTTNSLLYVSTDDGLGVKLEQNGGLEVGTNDGIGINLKASGGLVIESEELTIDTDSSPTDSSTKFVTSGAIFTSLASKQDTLTGAITSVASTDLSENVVVISDGNGKLAPADVTATELSYLDGVTSSIQTQLNAKLDALTGAVLTTTDQSIDGVKEFNSDISGNISRATLAASVTNGVYTTDTKTVTAAMLADDAVDLSGSNVITGVLQLANGGTGATTASDAATALGLGTGDSPTFTNITSSSAPSNASHVTTKSYVDGLLQGLNLKESVRVATTATGTLASAFANGEAIDGVTLATNDRILIKDQESGSEKENGIYKVNTSGAPTRVDDASTAAELRSAFVFVEEGTANADKGFVCTTETVPSSGTFTLDTDAVAFTQFSSAGSFSADDSTLSLSGTTFSVKAEGIANAQISASAGIEITKLDTSVTKDELNILDGGTSATNTTVVDADRVVFNDDGTMQQVAVTDLDTYFSATTKTLTNKTLDAVALGTPLSGVLTNCSGTASSLTAGSATTLTGLTATVAELNLMDAGTTQATVTLVDADGVVVNDADGTMTQCLVSDFGTYIAGATLTLTNKTLTAPVISDSNAKELIKFAAGVTDAVNEVTISNAATTNGPIISASGDDDNIDLTITPKGTGSVVMSKANITSLSLNSAAITSTATELNLMDADTTQATVTLVDGDGVVINDADDTMKQCLVSDFGTYIAGSTLTLTNKTLTTPVISSISNTGTLTLPTSNDTLVGRATTDTLTNKTLTAPQINDASSDHQYIFASSDLDADRTVTLPLLTGDDEFVFAAQAQTLTNKTLTAPVLTNPSVSKAAVTSDVATSEGAVTSNTSGISHTLTLAADLVDDATHADITITSDKVLATSVVLANASVNVDVRIHTVVTGSFKVSITNKSGSTLADDSTMVLNYAIL